ncbi:MAG: acetolactate synthase, partial [Selenomonadaceae bacterium]|nr:acetolactate synthase [Selenomonadaceae bacterium]
AIADKAGDLNNLLQNFSEANVNIEYMYAFAGKENAYMIFRVNDTKKAEAILKSKGLKSLTQEEISAV